jgi:DNA-binding XRE family transcriptional regulator
MFYDTSGIKRAARRQSVDGILSGLELERAPAGALRKPKTLKHLTGPLLCVADVDQATSQDVLKAWDGLPSLNRHLCTLVLLSTGSRRERPSWAADLVCRASEGSVSLVEVKRTSDEKMLAQLRTYFTALVSRFAPDSIRSVDYASPDEILWVEFGDGLRRAFPWRELPFVKKARGIRAESVRPSEHKDAIVFDTERGEVDVDAAALRMLNDDSGSGARGLTGALSTLGPRLQAIRKAKGISQETLAEASGLPQPTISRIESGEREPRLATLDKYAHGLGVTLVQLMAETSSGH